GGVNPAQFRYITANTEYYAYTDFGAGTYAYIWGRGFDIAGASTGASRVRLLNSGGNYSLTVPTALPASQVLMQLDNAGQMTASNSIPSNANVTLQGTGYVRHGRWSRGMAFGFGANASAGAGASITGGTPGYHQNVSSTVFYPLGPLRNQVISDGVNGE